ncbi:hypothetical protein EYF80_023419 [Liparis tanakae]|uniref:Uncharacterized protein n=1 Tax=Liparis tanakae TaxID=230148 RepID=A0A4Z2HLE5_9TELE|nr:hypothetical protein EYF80_023419 [Liparis tanakae]
MHRQRVWFLKSFTGRQKGKSPRMTAFKYRRLHKDTDSSSRLIFCRYGDTSSGSYQAVPGTSRSGDKDGQSGGGRKTHLGLEDVCELLIALLTFSGSLTATAPHCAHTAAGAADEAVDADA